MRNLARCAFFLSGIAGLTFEIVWVRHLGLALGTTTAAVATTTAAYMGGLALGSFFGGRVADRLRRPLAVYGAIELGVAVLGLLIPTVCIRLPALHASLMQILDNPVWDGGLRLGLAFGVLMVPTVAMGATLPILARVVGDRIDTIGRDVGVLYAINTTGALLGAALCGFWWIPAWGLERTNALAVGLDAILGIAALVLGWVIPQHRAGDASASGNDAMVWRPGTRTLVALLAVTGAAAMALQVLWTRALGTALGPSTYAFSAIVCAYLAGLALGSWVAARIADRILAIRLGLVVALLGTGAFTLLGIAWIDDLPNLLRAIVLDRSLTVSGLMRAEFFLAALSVLPATVGMGSLFPLTLSAVAGDSQRLGAAVGRAYATNTVGAIVGCFGGVFVLLPALGVEGAMRAAAMTYGLAALVMVRRLEPSVPSAVRYGAAVCSVALLGLTVAWPRWDISNWTSGMYRLSMTRAYYAEPDSAGTSQMLFHRDGLASTVTVEEESGVRWVKINGKIDGSNEGDMPTQILSGLLPMLIHPNPQDVVVIGCGTCVTVGAALQAQPRQITLVELEKEVVNAARLFSDVNHSPWESPTVKFVEDDGRHFLARQQTPVDVIISEPSNPWMTGAASLFTVEFFQAAAARLGHQGLFVQWLQMYELAPDRIASVLKTFHAVFPEVLVFSAHTDSNDVLLVGSQQPVVLDLERLTQRFDILRDELARAELASVEDLLALLLFSDHEINTLGADIPFNTDDNAYIEFGAPKDLVAFAEDDPGFVLVDAVAGHRSEILHRAVRSTAPWPEVLTRAAKGYLHQGMLEDAKAAAVQLAACTPPPRQVDLDEMREVTAITDLLAGEDAMPVIDSDVLKTPTPMAEAVHLMVTGEEAAALHFLEERPSVVRQSSQNLVLYGYLLYRNAQFEAAHKTLLRAQKAADAADLASTITYYLGRNAYFDGNYKQAAAYMQQTRQTQPSLSALKVQD